MTVTGFFFGVGVPSAIFVGKLSGKNICASIQTLYTGRNEAEQHEMAGVFHKRRKPAGVFEAPAGFGRQS
jgi:hypothetical protein